MNVEVINKWIDALRSGEYKQGTRRLCTRADPLDESSPRLYCATGVLCELAHIQGVTNKDWDVFHDAYFYGNEFTSVALTPYEVLDWADFPWALIREVMVRNDRGKTFRDISFYLEDLIRREQRGELFV